MTDIFYGKFDALSQSSNLPITLDDLKNFSSIRWQGGTEDDVNFTNILNTAILTFENITNRTVISRNYDLLLCGFHNFIYEYTDPKEYPFNQIIDIRKAGIQSVNNIQYQIDNVYNTLSSAKYRIYKDKCSTQIRYARSNKDFPTNYDVNENGSSIIGAVKINFDAGYTTSNIPHDIKFTILSLASHYYNIDLSCADRFDSNTHLPTALMNLISNFICYYI